MEHYTLQTGLPEQYTPPAGAFRLRYADLALEVARQLDIELSCLPILLETSRAELVEIVRDGDTTERLHYRLRMGNREIVLVVSPILRGRRLMTCLEPEG